MISGLKLQQPFQLYLLLMILYATTKMKKRRSFLLFPSTLLLCFSCFQIFYSMRKNFGRRQEETESFSRSFNNIFQSNQLKQTVSLCTLAKDEEAYIDEWVDYHFSLGFSEILIYDNSITNELAFWKSESRLSDPRIEIVHWPFVGQHREALHHCAKRSIEKNHTWCGVFDGDEFLVLRKHIDVISFLEEHLHSGALSLNWYFFGDNNHSVYTPNPVTKRFTMRQPTVNRLVKSFVKLTNLKLDHLIESHFPYLVNSTQHDTNNNTFFGPFNPDGPSDVAVINHYWTKSKKEFHHKGCVRGIVDVVNKSSKENLGKCGVHLHLPDCTVFDNSAWLQFCSRVPRYRMFDLGTDWITN